ncbi:MAG: TIGR03564 family F420-dependent LLM class oxidoreductase [Chloroflexi bacterium]|nr:TIGR03564 family F420-dependent LLM class oxidoreductase [Chloroflexota bacterium]
MKIGLLTRGSGGILGIADEAHAAEEAGFEHFIVPSTYGHDPVSVLTVAATRTSAIRLATGVQPIFPRHPAAAAAQAVSACAASHGRFTFGIGLSHRRSVEESYRMSFGRPAARMREYLDILQPLLAGEQVDYQGEFYSYRGIIRSRDRETVPVLLAAMGPAMLRLAGERTAGTILWMAGAQAIREHVAPRITRAASEAGRPAPEIVATLPITLTTYARRAREHASEQFANYAALPSYRDMLDRSGAEGAGDVLLAGDEAALRAQLTELKEAGATSFTAWLFDDGTGSRDRTRDFLASLAPGL